MTSSFYPIFTNALWYGKTYVNVHREDGLKMSSYEDDILNHIRDGYFICNNCESIMNLNDDDRLVCASCGYMVNHDEYYEENNDDIPYGCAACGGPYPQCKTSCKLFDD